MADKLTGFALVEFVNRNPQMDFAQQMEEAGYTKIRDGKTSYLKTAFLKALSVAQGIKIAADPYKPPTKKLNYEVKASNRGVIPVSQCYASQVGINPGDYCKIEVEDDLLILTRVKEDPDIDLASERDRLEEPACPI